MGYKTPPFRWGFPVYRGAAFLGRGSGIFPEPGRVQNGASARNSVQGATVALPKKQTMKFEKLTRVSAGGAALLGAMALLAGCQCGPGPVREYRIDKTTTCSPAAKACATSTHITEVQRNVSVWPVAEKPSARPYLFMPKSGACPPALNPPVPTPCTSALQEGPDGIWHLSGGPLYYNPENLNWEQAPPFGRW